MCTNKHININIYVLYIDNFLPSHQIPVQRGSQASYVWGYIKGPMCLNSPSAKYYQGSPESILYLLHMQISQEERLSPLKYQHAKSKMNGCRDLEEEEVSLVHSGCAHSEKMQLTQSIT